MLNLSLQAMVFTNSGSKKMALLGPRDSTKRRILSFKTAMRANIEKKPIKPSAAPFAKIPRCGRGFYDFGFKKNGAAHGVSETPLANPGKKDLIVFFTRSARRLYK